MEEPSLVLQNLESVFRPESADLGEWEKQYLSKHRDRYRATLEVFLNHYEGGEVLEVGSVPCHLTYCLDDVSDHVVGVDLMAWRSADFIRENRLDLVVSDIERVELPFPNNTFSFCLLCEVIEHLRINPIHALREIQRVLKPDGRLLITTPNLYAIGRLKSFLRGEGFESPYEQFHKLYEHGHVGHIRVYARSEILELLTETEFDVIDSMYMNFGYDFPGPVRGRVVNGLRSLLPTIRPFHASIATPSP